MSKRSERVRVRDMIDVVREAATLVQGRSRGDLDTDIALKRALERLVEIVGEAAKGVSDGTRVLAPSVPWRELAGMRDKVIHSYFEVDLNIVWETATKELPSYLSPLEALLNALPQNPPST